MDERPSRLELMFSPSNPLRISQTKFLDYFQQYDSRLDLSAAEISELWELLKKDIISLGQAFDVIRLLGRQWHPQAEKALTDCYLKLEDPLSNWAALGLGSYYTYSTLTHVQEILTKELETHFATDPRLRSRAQEMLSEVARRLAPPKFIKLEIKIDRADPPPIRYKAEIIRSSHFPQDEGESDIFGFSAAERSQIEDFLQTWQRRTLAETDLSKIGKLLYKRLFGGRLSNCLDNCLVCSRQDARFAGVALTLHLADPWLLDLPWSCLYDNDEKKQNFLVRDCDVTIALRRLTERSALRPWDRSRTTRLLVIVSQPDNSIRQSLLKAGIGLVDVDTKKEEENFCEGLKKWNRDSDRLLSIDIVHARDDRIFDFMSDNRFDYDAIHYFGHCLHDGEHPCLVFEDTRGPRGPLRTAQDFFNLVGKNRALQLVTLVACQSAVRTTGAAAYRSLAEEILAAGVPTVVAMQTAIRRSTGLTFARHFYHQLIRTESASTAFHKAVQAITVRPPGDSAEAEWAAPALFIRR